MKKLRVWTLGVVLVAAGCQGQQSTPPAGATTGTTPATAQAAQPAKALQVINWGPKTVKTGENFNLQPDGNSGVFFELDGDVPAVAFTATLGDKPLEGVVASGKVVTATIPAEYLSTAGTFAVELQIPSQGARIPVGSFTVEAK